MTYPSTRQFSCLPALRMAHRLVIDGCYAALTKPPEPTSEEERIRMLREEVERINQAVPVNNGKPAIMGEVGA